MFCDSEKPRTQSRQKEEEKVGNVCSSVRGPIIEGHLWRGSAGSQAPGQAPGMQWKLKIVLVVLRVTYGDKY